ncbi:hypothetical protein [Actinomadura chibensis]|uniref:Uncharacterized protein n=1 Tax=Actinomadura chibensis TaxID=392828 RepID=A0A5D0NAR3_9ACTN|nr:hypothetical protein [Actinomadura chibensis]TYB41472.1 hypothetical protein FXF69_35750 [Actinomadura chibensis]
MPQRLVRLGSASAAVSAGAIVLVLSAGPADAAAAEVCKKGTDPASTIENWKCNLGNLREAILPKSPAAPTPAPTKPASPAPPKKTSKTTPHKAPARTPPRRAAPRGAPPPSTMTDARGLRPYGGAAPPSGTVAPPGVLPPPEVADPDVYQTSGTPRTRLVSPVAAAEDGGAARTPWVAAAAGAAGAVAALHFSVAGRALRRRAAPARR